MRGVQIEDRTLCGRRKSQELHINTRTLMQEQSYQRRGEELSHYKRKKMLNIKQIYFLKLSS